MIKKVVFILIIFCCATNVSAVTKNVYYSTCGFGTFSYSAETNNYDTIQLNYYYDNSSHSAEIIYAYVTWYAPSGGGSMSGNGRCYLYGTASTIYNHAGWGSIPGFEDAHGSYNIQADYSGLSFRNVMGMSTTGTPNPGVITIVVNNSPITTYTISGYQKCLNYCDLYIKNNSAQYVWVKRDLNENYEFTICNGVDYKLVFSDAHEYEFVCSENIVYNRDLCSYFTINLYDNCANLLQNSSVDIYKCADIPAETKLIYQGSDSSINLLLGTDCNISDRIDIYIDTTDGTEHRIIYADSISDNLYHSYINWDMTIHVVDDDTDTNIQYANVICTQGCSINLPNQKTAQTQLNGKVVFTGLSNQNMVINVEKSDYAVYSQTINPSSVFDCWSTGGSYTVYLNSTNASDNWNNNTHNDSKDINGEGNTTLPNNAQWGCGVYFKNTNSIIVNQINDSDAYVDLYYWAKMENCTMATLKFQEQLYTTWYDSVVYTILNNSYEYRRILNANFTDYTNGYRGYIYNATCGCNDIQKLKIVNQTYEQQTNYKNLSARCKFQNKLSGNQIDYRSVVNIRIYANSTNTTLMDITAYLMNQTTVVDSKVLNWADFTTNNGYYIWLPDYKYTSGYNYTVNITGYNGYQLDTDEVWTADIIGNSLKINIKDNHGIGITQATIFVEGWGSQSLVSGTYGVITGLPDGDCQYKATKSGYISSGWNTITLSGIDKTVTCILTKQSTESITGYKLKDQEVKAFLIPLLYLLFILIIVGGVINAAKP